MLKSLYISSFVIIDELNVDFEDSMSVLTGETGAGKSIIIDAIGQLCGNRASASFVRKGCSKAIIQGIFALSETQELVDIFEELGLSFEDETIITKTIDAKGKSTIRINYRPVTNQALKLLAPHLIHIHSQFETQSLFNIKRHIQILDHYIGNEIDEALQAYKQYYGRYRELEKEIKKLEEEDFSDEQIEFYQAQFDELKDLDLSDDDVQELEDTADIMKNYETIHESIRSISQLIDGDNQVLDKLNEALHILGGVDGFSDEYDRLYDTYYGLSDIYDAIMNRFNSYEFDEYRYNEIQEQLYQIQRLKRRYGYSMDDIYQARDDLEMKIQRATHREEILNELYHKRDQVYNQAHNQAKVLHDIRLKGAHAFEKEIKQQLNDLYLTNANLKVDFKQVPLHADGSDNVTLTVAMNKGQSYTPLNESASGGEISRLMLAIKIITLVDSAIDTIIFDEVDTGVSGKVADAIGSKMAILGQSKQVICITHLPQVAVYGQHHYAIMKATDDDATYTSMALLNEDERIIEIAKMLSGDEISDDAIANAKSLLK
ncbi:MAG: DNA repair protein RecN [Erysipelotrichaceae bacterium]|nr:DNA repair protein RecN [Erysipelotrichaceae bacterium]